MKEIKIVWTDDRKAWTVVIDNSICCVGSYECCVDYVAFLLEEQGEV